MILSESLDMTPFLHRLGRAGVRRRRRAVAVWALVAMVVIGIAQNAGGRTSDAFAIPGVEAQHALDVLEDDFPAAAAGSSAQVGFTTETGTLADPRARAAVDGTVAGIAGQPDVTEVGELQRSPDGRIGYVDVSYARPSEDIRDDAYRRLEVTRSATNDAGVVRLELGGDLPTEAALE